MGADRSTQTIAGLTEWVEVMRRVWSGDAPHHDVGPVGPPPVQPGGPAILVGTMGRRTVRHAAAWADGLAGVTLDLDLTQVRDLFDLARGSWGRRGRTPRLTTSFFVAIGEKDQARAQVHQHLRHYMSWLPTDLVDALAPTTGYAGPVAGLVELLERFAELGTDEVHLIPTSADVAQVEDLAQAAAAVA